MGSSLPNVKKLLQTASAGEKQALKHLGIDRGFTYECPPRFNPATTSKEALQQQLTDTIFFAEVANRLHLDSAEEVARTAIQHIIHSYFCLFDHLPDVDSILSGPDLAKELLDNIVKLTWATQILHRFEKEGSNEAAEDSNEAAEDSNASNSEGCSDEYHLEGSLSESCSSSENHPADEERPATSEGQAKEVVPGTWLQPSPVRSWTPPLASQSSRDT